MSKLLLLTIIAIALLLGWLWFAGSTDHAVPGEAVSVSPTEPSPSATPVDRSLDGESRPSAPTASREAVASDATATITSAKTTPTAPPGPAKHRLVGRVIHIDTREPVANCRFEFVQLETPTSIQTDADGRFESPPVFAVGNVELRTEPFWLVAEPVHYSKVEPDRLYIPNSAEPAHPLELELIATPAARIDVDVRSARGIPRPGATVMLSVYPRSDPVPDPSRADPWHCAGTVRCDENGRASFWIPRDNLNLCALALQAVCNKRGSGGISRLLTLEPPLPSSPVVLTVDGGGMVSAYVSTVGGRLEPRPHLEVRIELDPSLPPQDLTRMTDERGVAGFPNVPAGIHQISVNDPKTGEWCRRQIDLTAAGDVHIGLALREPDAKLALGGRVFDEDGDPLSDALVYASGPQSDRTVSPGPDGSFELWMLPCEILTVSVSSGESIFTPETARVPFGTTGFVARRTAALERQLVVRVIDAHTREPIRSARVTNLTTERPTVPSHDGLATVTLELPFALARDCLRVSARGYKTATHPCAALSPQVSTSGYITIELEPGFARRLTVVDAETRVPLENVTFRQSPDRELRSDSDGVVVFEDGELSAPFQVELNGYRTIQWDPRNAPVAQNILGLEASQ